MHLNHDEMSAKVKNVEHVLFGPWVGELGWELFGCQGYLRKMRRDNPHLKTFNIISRTGRSFIYEDFCDSYIEFDCPGENITGALCQDWPTPHSDIQPKDIKNSIMKKLGLTEDNCLYIPSHTFLVDYHADGPGREERLPKFTNSQLFHKYKSKTIKKSPYKVLIHARNAFHHGTSNKNWPGQSWDKLCSFLHKKGYKLGAIGTKHESSVPNHCDDLRGISIEDTVSYLNKSKFLITTCSGPAHLASLCDTDMVVMTAPQNIHRYATDWNPFNSKREVIYEQGWNPDTDYVIERVKSFLK